MVAAVGAATFAQVSSDRVLIVVNGTPITGDSYYRRMEVLPDVGRIVGNQVVPATPGFLTLQKLINETLMLQLAKEKGVEPTTAQIDEELAYRVSQNPDYMKLAQQVGFTEADIKHEIKVDLSEFNVTTMGINITNFEVDKFYADQKTQFTLPKRYRLRVIAVEAAADKAAVDQDLQAGKTFAEVAKTRSAHYTKVNEGLMGDLPESGIGENIKAMILTMKEGAATPWIEAESGTPVKFYLEKILPSEVVPLTDSLKRQIRRTMMVDRGRVRNNIPVMMRDMRRKAQLEFKGTPFDEQIRQLFEVERG